MDVDGAGDVDSATAIIDVEDFRTDDEDLGESEHDGEGEDQRSPATVAWERDHLLEAPKAVRDWRGDIDMNKEEEPVKKVSYSQTHEKETHHCRRSSPRLRRRPSKCAMQECACSMRR